MVPRLLTTEQSDAIRTLGGRTGPRFLTPEQQGAITALGGRVPALPTPAPLPIPTAVPTPGPGEQPAPTDRVTPGSIEAGRRGLAHGLRLYGQQFAFEGPTQFFDFLQDTSALIADTLKVPRGTIFRSIADLSRIPEAEKLTPQGLGEEITGRIARAITGDLPAVGLATAAGGPVAGFAGLGALQAKLGGADLTGIVSEAMKGALTGGAFKGAEVLTRPAKTAALALIGGTEAASRGDLPEAAAGAATLAILGQAGAGTVTAREALGDFQRARQAPPAPERAAETRQQQPVIAGRPGHSDRDWAPKLGPWGRAEVARPEAPRTGIREGSAFSISHPNAQINFRYDVVPLDSLKVNDPEVQPRNRSRFAGREQVLENARTFNANRYIAGNTELDRGLPIVGPDLKVESGNGRIQTLRELRDQAPEKFTAFSAELQGRAREFGLRPEDFGGLRDPVVVRTRTTSDADLAQLYEIDPQHARRAFADDANARTGLAFSEPEQAASDASRVSLGTINNLDIPISGSIDEALRGARNRRVVGEFLDTFPRNERGELLNADGTTLTQKGVRRLKFAIMARVFPGEGGERLLTAASESIDSNVKNTEAGIFGAVGRLAELKARSAAGQINGDVDISEDVSAAVRDLARIRAAGGTVEDALRQTELGRGVRPPIQEELLRAFGAAKSAKQVRELLNSYVDVTLKLGPSGRMDLGGARPAATKMDVWKVASKPGRAEKTAAEEAAQQGSFARAPDVMAREPRNDEELEAAVRAASAGHGPVASGPGSSFGGRMADTPEDRAGLQKRSEIVAWLRQQLEVPIRTGHMGPGVRSALGIFKVKPEVIRSRLALDIPTIAHEVGHMLDKRFFSGGFKIGAGTFKQFKDELDPIASKPRAGQSKTPEGFAEFMRLYLTDRSQGRSVAPRTHAFFEATLQRDAPEVLDALRETRKMYRRWEEQPDEAKILASMSINEKTDKGIDRRDIYRAAVDDLKALNDFVHEAVGPEQRNVFGRRIPHSNIAARDNPYLLARVNRGWIGIAESFLRKKRGAVNMQGDIVGPALEVILGPVTAADRLNDYRVYSYARRTRELVKQGRKTGIDPEVARRAFDRLHQDPLMRDTFDAQRIWRGHLRRYLVDAEVLAEEGKARMEALHEDFVPLHRVMDEAVSDGPPGSGSTFANLFNPIQRLSREGSTREIIDPLEVDVKNAHAFINVAERAQIGRAIVRLARSMHGGGKWVEEGIPEPMRPVPITPEEFERMLAKYSRRVVSKHVSETLGARTETTTTTGPGGAPETRSIALIEAKVREALSARGFAAGEVDQYINRLRAAKSEGDRTTIIKEITEKIRTVEIKEELELDLPDELIDIFRPSHRIPRDEPIVRVFEKGRGKLVRLHPALYDAVLRLDRATQADLLTRIARPFTHALRAGATTLSTEFGPRNVIKDQVSGFIQSKYGYHPGHFLIGLAHLLRDKLPGGDKLVAEYERSGALLASLVSLDRAYAQMELIDITGVPGLTATLLDAGRHPIRTLGLLSTLSEQPTRLGGFRLALRQARKMGLTGREPRLRAGFEAREMTTDFGRIGAQTQALNQQIAFFNPNIQGTDKFLRSIRDDPVGVAVRTLAAVTLPSLLFWAANHDDARVQDLPQLQRDRHWILSTARMPRERWDRMSPEDKVAFNDAHPLFRLPKPYDVGLLFGSLVEHALDWAVAKRPAEMGKFARGLLDSMLPGYVPTVALPLIENYGNWAQWTDRPIVPPGAEDLDPALQKAGYTSETATRIAAAIDFVDHGTDIIPEQFRSPAKVENLIRGWTAGAGLTAITAIDAALSAGGITDLPPRPTRTWADIPGIRGFVARYPSASAQPLADFYERYGRIQRYQKSFNVLLKTDVTEAQKVYERHVTDLNLSPGFAVAADQLNALRGIQQRLYASRELTPDAKHAAIDAVTLQMIDLARHVNASAEAVTAERQRQ